MRLRILLALMLLLPVAAHASVALELSLEQLAQRADVVVRGRVNAQQAAWTRGGRIVTTVSVAVDEVLKGAAAQNVEVRHLGGHVGDIGQQVSGEVSFAPGEEVVLFLHAHPSVKGAFAVVGMSQGKFHLERAGDKVTARQDLSGLGLVAAPGAPIQDKRAEPLTLDELRARVKAAAP